MIDRLADDLRLMEFELLSNNLQVEFTGLK